MKKVKRFFYQFYESAQNIYKVRNLVLIAMFIALITLGDVMSVNISKDLKISFGFIFFSATGFFFGPTVAAVSGAIVDLLSYVIRSDGYAFDFRFTLAAALTGIIYGIFLYKRDTGSRYFMVWCFLAKFFVNLIINVIITTYLMRGYLGNANELFSVARIYKNVIMLPIEMLVIYFLLKALPKAVKLKE